jgi:tetratricopeptide (TPR) repeat protein
MELLPISIPAGLSAQDSYELGLRYRLAGWVGLAREALSRTVELDRSGPLAAKAQKVINTQLPRLPVPPQAEQRNIEAYNLMSSDRERAKAIFTELMSQYPDFEWPFSNLAKLYIQEGKLNEARGLGKYLLSVNPDLLRSLTIMVEVCLSERNFEEALGYIQRSLKHYPDDEQFRQLALLIRVQTKGMPSGEIPEGLSANEYYELGVDFELIGKLELSRQCLQRAIEMDPDSSLAGKAADYMRSHLPHQTVSPEVEQRYQKAASMIVSNRQSAQEEFEKLMMEEPDFEFSALMLATLAMQDGSSGKAERLLRRVLHANPHLGAATTLLVGLYANEGRVSEGLSLIEKTLDSLDWPDNGLDLDILKAQLQLYGHHQ